MLVNFPRDTGGQGHASISLMLLTHTLPPLPSACVQNGWESAVHGDWDPFDGEGKPLVSVEGELMVS